MDDQSNVVAIRANREQEARAAFGNYVQSVAFNLTLSRQMILGLELVRDYWKDAEPLPTLADPRNKSPRLYQYGRAVPMLHSLERRGLVWHDYIRPSEAPRGHRSWKLTKAGELVCDLLIEAGLMAPREKAHGKKRA